MIVMGWKTRDVYADQMNRRFSALMAALEGRQLVSGREGCRCGNWKNPECMCVLAGDPMAIRLAVDDLKPILAEVRRLKDTVR